MGIPAGFLVAAMVAGRTPKALRRFVVGDRVETRKGATTIENFTRIHGPQWRR